MQSISYNKPPLVHFWEMPSFRPNDKSRSYEVTLERVRVQTTYISKCMRCFVNIRGHMARRDAYEDKHILYSQPARKLRCMESEADTWKRKRLET